MKNNHPIGIFDSGIGGLAIVRCLAKIMPTQPIIYFADKANFPYGNKSPVEIRKLALINAKMLIAQKVKLIIIACNTATVIAIDHLRKKFPSVIFIGTEPAVKPAAIACTKAMIILSSPKTAGSKQLHQLINNYAKNIKVFNIGNLQLVKAVEEQWPPDKINILLEKITNSGPGAI